MTDPTLPVPNIPLLRKAVEWAEAEAAKPFDDREWDQDWFAKPTHCGTSHCIAGWAVMQAVPGARVTPPPGVISDLHGLEIDGQDANWWDTARDLLGITQAESYELFAPDNEIGTIRAVAEQIAARAGERL